MKRMIDFLLKYLSPNFVIALGAGISILGGYLASKKADKDAEESGKKVDLIKNLSEEIKILSNINNDFARENITFSKNNEEHLKQVKDKADQINKEVTGGDSYCRVFLSFIYNTNKPHCLLALQGDTKLENVNMTITDNKKLLSILHLATTMPADDFLKLHSSCSFTYFYKILYPKTGIPNVQLNLDEQFDDIDLIFDIRFGNRHTIQRIIAEKYKNENTRIIENRLEENGKIIHHTRASANQNLSGLFSDKGSK